MSSKTNKILIRTSNITKTYRVWKTPSQRLLALVLDLILNVFPDSKRIKRWLQQTYTTVEALKETSLTLRAGEAIGIIGRNGAGKSTLLQMITGSLTPTSGTIERNGRIAALLELGSGFDPECTGVENVRLNATILGLTNDEIEEKFESILEYADIGNFVYQPVKTYSSGMRMRLAFAVAAHVEADVIIIDEALSVGDARFQLKCAKTIEGHLKRGSSLLFVSHNMNAVKQLCASAVLLNEGEMLMEGRPNEVANIYSRITAGDSLVKVKKQIEELESNEFEIAETLSVSVDQVVGIEVGSEFKYNGLGIDDLKQRLSNFCLVGGESRFKLLEEWSLKPPDSSGNEFSYGGELGRIENIRISDIKGHERLVHTTGDRFDVSFDVVSYEYFLEPIFAITFKDVKGQELYVYNTLFAGLAIGSISKDERRRVQFSQTMNLMQGEYFISLGFVTFVGEELLVINRRYDVVKVQVLPLDKCNGLANMYTQTRVDTINE